MGCGQSVPELSTTDSPVDISEPAISETPKPTEDKTMEEAKSEEKKEESSAEYPAPEHDHIPDDRSEGSVLDLDIDFGEGKSDEHEDEVEKTEEEIKQEIVSTAMYILNPAQLQGIKFVRSKCQEFRDENRDKLLPKLEQYQMNDILKEDIADMLADHIKHTAPIMICIRPAVIVQYLKKDDHYRNLFEIGKSGGQNSKDVRRRWEKNMFGGSYDASTDFDRVKYGSLAPTLIPHEYTAQYGSCYLLLKSYIRRRTTLTLGDSGGCSSVYTKFGTVDEPYGILSNMSDELLRATVMVVLGIDNYQHLRDKHSQRIVEAQFHGPIRLRADVDTIVIKSSTPTEETQIMDVAGQYGIRCIKENEYKEECNLAMIFGNQG